MPAELPLHQCVADRCADGRKNFDETDVDCGGLTCLNRCLGGCTTTSDCRQDQGERVCGAQNTCVTRLSPGERDLNSQFAFDRLSPAMGGTIDTAGLFGTTTLAEGVGVDPASGLFGLGTLPFGPDAGCIGGVECSSTLVNYQKLKFTSYANGSKVFESEEIARNQWRFKTTRVVPFSEVGGYYFHDAGLGARRYFMCGGNRTYTNTGAGEVNPANGFAPNQPCKGVDLNGGYDFSETRFFEHRGLSATGLTNFSGRMTTGNPNNNIFVSYVTPGAIHAVWVK